MTHSSLLQNRVAILATKHEKERVIAPLFAKTFNMRVLVPNDFNSDRFGTFTREIKRLGTQIETAKLKAESALEMMGGSLAIASEGSFYPHPSFPFISCNREVVLLLDKDNDLMTYGEEISLQTNHNHKTVKNIEEALAFAEEIGFPDHGLVVMFDQKVQSEEQIFKGITSQALLIEKLGFVLEKSSSKTAHLETDMRAMYNPTRMNVIEKATHNLIQKLNQLCPQCDFPGFDVVERRSGLPCALCHAPTPLIMAETYQCQHCDFQEERLFPNKGKAADPSQCLYCNP